MYVWWNLETDLWLTTTQQNSISQYKIRGSKVDIGSKVALFVCDCFSSSVYLWRCYRSAAMLQRIFNLQGALIYTFLVTIPSAAMLQRVFVRDPAQSYLKVRQALEANPAKMSERHPRLHPLPLKVQIYIFILWLCTDGQTDATHNPQLLYRSCLILALGRYYNNTSPPTPRVTPREAGWLKLIVIVNRR